MSRADFAALGRRWLLGPAVVHHVATLNAEMVVAAETDAAFRRALAAADLRTPDGSGLFWARQYSEGTVPFFSSLVRLPRQRYERVPGVDSLLALAGLASAEHRSLYLLGGTPAQAQGAASALRRQFGRIRLVVGPPHAYALAGPPEVLADIAKHQPDILAVAYGAVKQARWIERHRSHLPGVRIAIGVGGALAVLAGEVPRAPAALQKRHLEWAWRWAHEPRRAVRMWRAVVQFPWLVRRHKLKAAAG